MGAWNFFVNTKFDKHNRRILENKAPRQTLWSMIMEAIIEKPGITKKEICAAKHLPTETCVCTWALLRDEGLYIMQRQGRTFYYYPTQKGARIYQNALDKSEELYQHLANIDKIRFIRKRLREMNSDFCEG